MGWMILIAIVVLMLTGCARGSNSGPSMDRSDSDERSENGDDQMLEDWYASQELDNDLDDWDR
jgi:hypothetical protein